LINTITENKRVKYGVYIVLSLLALVMIILSFVQLWILYTTTDVSGWSTIPANSQGLPPDDRRGAYVMLNEEHNPFYQSDLIELLATTEPGVVDENAGAHLQSGEIKMLLIQSAALNESTSYRVYRYGEPVVDPMKYERRPGGKLLFITPESGTWKPGTYIVDIPAEGMFGGRTYFQFYVDDKPQG
jgi:hypothetical protein